MNITINGEIINFPTSLSDITLGQRIDFHNECEQPLLGTLKEISEMEDGILKELLMQDFHDELAMRFVAFFSGCTTEAVRETDAAVVLSLYNTVFLNFQEEESNIELQSEYMIDGELWQIQSPVLHSSHPMKFAELLDSKQILKDMVEDNGSRWDLLLKLSCIFLRKVGEPYTSELLEEERTDKMKRLPLDIAIRVGFFLTSSISLYQKTLLFSKEEAERSATI